MRPALTCERFRKAVFFFFLLPLAGLGGQRMNAQRYGYTASARPVPAASISKSPRWDIASMMSQMEGLLTPNNDLVLMAAHRAAWRNYPENSESAIREAFEDGNEAIEIDVRFTSDNQCIVLHDTGLNRLVPNFGTDTAPMHLEADLRASYLRTARGLFVPQRAGNKVATNAGDRYDHVLNLYDVLAILDEYVQPGPTILGPYSYDYFGKATGPMVIIDIKNAGATEPDITRAAATALLASCTQQVQEYITDQKAAGKNTAVPAALVFKTKLAAFVDPAHACVPYSSDAQWANIRRRIVGVLTPGDVTTIAPENLPLFTNFANSYLQHANTSSEAGCLLQFEFDQASPGDQTDQYMNALDAPAAYHISANGRGYASWQMTYFYPEGVQARGEICCFQGYFANSDQSLVPSGNSFPEFRPNLGFSVRRSGATLTTTDQTESMCSLLLAQGRRNTALITSSGTAQACPVSH